MSSYRPTWTSRIVLAALAAALLAGGFPGAAVAAAARAGKVKAPGTGAYVGTYTGEAPFDANDLSAYRKRAGENPAIVMWYQPWAGSSGRTKFDTAACVRVWQQGAIPLITWEPWDPQGDPKYLKDPGNQPTWTLASIIQGKHDKYIRTWARDARNARGPIMIRLMHEMNGSWYPWGVKANGNSASQYRAAWRHVVRIFRKEGATNVTWVWAPNAPGVSPKKDPFSTYWPGAAYVDWVGLSGYNWGTTRTDFKHWRSFEDIYQRCLLYVRRYKKPIMIAEMGCVTKGGDKAAWIRTAYKKIRSHKEVKAVVYYDRSDVGLIGKQDWRIDSSAGAAKAYRAAVRSTYFKGPTPKTLRDWRASLTNEQWVTLKAVPRLY